VAAAAKSAAKFFDATGPSASAAANPAEMTANMLVADSASAASFIAAPTSDAASSSSAAGSVDVGAGVKMVVVLVEVRCTEEGVALTLWPSPRRLRVCWPFPWPKVVVPGSRDC
jgi:hypothetical protein